MIERSDRDVTTKVPVVRCSDCGKHWDDTDEGRKEAFAHAATHAPLLYLHPDNRYCDTVWIEEGCLIRGGRPWKEDPAINHANRGFTAVDWKGPGWYVFHEYDVHYHNDTRHYTEFRHVDEAYSELREKLRGMARDLASFRGIQKTPRPGSES